MSRVGPALLEWNGSAPVIEESPRTFHNAYDFLLERGDSDDRALITLKGEHTFRDVRKAASAVAAHLTMLGTVKGDRILLISDNSFFWVAAYLGALKAGLVCVPASPTSSGQEIQYLLEVTEAKCALLQASVARVNAQLFEKLPRIVDQQVDGLSCDFPVSVFPDLISRLESEAYVPADVCENDLAALMFTSGSTGKPKGVMVSHGNIIANTHSIVEYLNLTSNDRIMAVLPFHYCFGASLLHTHLRVGGSVVIDHRFMYPDKVLDRMLETKCTGFAGVPSHYQLLLKSSSIGDMTFSHLRYVQQAGGYLPLTSISKLQEVLPDTEIFVMYGQTEATARLSFLPPKSLESKLGSIGKGIPGVRLRVLNEAGEDILPGENGEIVAEGKNIACGYWQDQEETSASFRNGKLYTGDIATIDSDGFIYIVDRAKDFLKCGGKRVACRQIEQQILSFQDLVEVAVIGVPDETLGEAVKAFVVPTTVTPDLRERLHAFCKQTMPPQLLPREIIILNSLPKNEVGKVSKHLLRQH